MIGSDIRTMTAHALEEEPSHAISQGRTCLFDRKHERGHAQERVRQHRPCVSSSAHIRSTSQARLAGQARLLSFGLSMGLLGSSSILCQQALKAAVEYHRHKST